MKIVDERFRQIDPRFESIENKIIDSYEVSSDYSIILFTDCTYIIRFTNSDYEGGYDTDYSPQCTEISNDMTKLVHLTEYGNLVFTKDYYYFMAYHNLIILDESELVKYCKKLVIEQFKRLHDRLESIFGAESLPYNLSSSEMDKILLSKSIKLVKELFNDIDLTEKRKMDNN